MGDETLHLDQDGDKTNSVILRSTNDPRISRLAVMSTNPNGVAIDDIQGAGWRHPLIVLITGCLFVMAAATVGLGLALYSATSSRNNLQAELACRGKFNAGTQQALGAAVKALADSQVALGDSGATTLTGLASLATDDGALANILATVPTIIERINATGDSLQDAATLLQSAADAQEQALAACKQD